MNPNAVRSKDHVDLTFIFARLQEDGYITSDDIEKLKEIAERIDEPDLKWIAEDVRYVGSGMFIPNDKEFFVTKLDSIRFKIHRIIEQRAEERGSDIHITEKELITALPDFVLEHYYVSAEEYKFGDTLEREIRAYRGENEIELTVEDDLSSQKREVEISAVGLVRVEAYELIDELESEIVEEYLEKYVFKDTEAYIARHMVCDEFSQKTLTGEETWLYSCELNLKPINEKVESRRSFIEDIEDYLRDHCSVVSRSGDKIKAVCRENVAQNIIESLYEEARELASERAEDVYYDELLPSFEKDWEEFGQKQPIPLECETSYAYPHFGGFYYYVRCQGRKEYDISLDEIAKSYNDIYETLNNFVEHVEEVWYG